MRVWPLRLADDLTFAALVQNISVQPTSLRRSGGVCVVDP